MRYRPLGLAALFCLIFSLSGAATNSTAAQVASQCSPDLSFGDSVPCSITTPSEVDTYTFTANADDKVLIRMTRTTGIMAPEVTVYDPHGAFLCTTWADSIALIGSCTIPTAGTYTIRANDVNTDQTGDYTLYIQRLNNPGGTTLIAFGQTLPGTLSAVGKQNTYTFTANADDKALLRMTRTAGVIAPEITVYDPRGAFLCTTWADSIALIGSCSIPTAGTYTILANDRFTDQTGDYTLYIQRLNNPGGTRPIAFGQTLPGTLSAVGKQDTYTFTARVGDKVSIRMTRTAGAIAPEITVYDPRGAFLCTTWADSIALIGSCSIPTTGTYTILANDRFTDQTGDYALSLECSNTLCGPQRANAVYLPLLLN